MKLFKDYKNKLVDSYVTYLKTFNLSDKTLGFYLRSYHVHCPIYFILIMLFASQLYNIILLFLLIFLFISFFIFDGCILSSIEYKIDNVDITIIDSVLEINRIEVTPKNRMKISLYIAFIYLFFAFAIYFLRFGYSFYITNSIYDELNIFSGFFKKSIIIENVI
jgi:hypothetical protein